MKRLILPLLVIFASIALSGCNNSEFRVDGNFTAYSLSVSGNKPQVTMVTVTIEKGKVTGYDIDVRQGYRIATVADQGTVDTADDVTTYSFGWNEETKKQLGYSYKMHYNLYLGSLANPENASIQDYASWLEANNRLDWFQQAELLEAFWLENGVDSTEVDEEGNFLNVAGVSVSDSNYVDLAAEALDLARLGTFQAFHCSGIDLYVARMTMSPNGNIDELILDVHQGCKDTASGTFSWKTQTKQELGFDYMMHYNSYLASLDDQSSATTLGYQSWLEANNRLEWFEQVDTITQYIMDNGWNTTLQPIDGRGISLDGLTPLDETAGVTISTANYFIVLSLLFEAPSGGGTE